MFSLLLNEMVKDYTPNIVSPSILENYRRFAMLCQLNFPKKIQRFR